ncbi:MAG: bifunctional oligoribonuclease/PAP phosphatase NrnA [Planctomycetota bacterium]|nr:bifunctional oligoribonuclease/PAP phosphatase NrnA [Planctomycetota bacterium]
MTFEPDPVQESALEVLRRERRFLLIGHQRPDGDCLGAQAALARILQLLGKEVTIVNPDPPEARFDYLTGSGPFRSWPLEDRNGKLPEHDVVVLLDFNELARSGPVGALAGQAPSKKLVIDHHPYAGEPWWDEAFVDVGASASGILAYRIARLLDVELDEIIAHAVFTSIATDTGWFRYSNTNLETMSVAAELMQHGVEPWKLYRQIYQRSPAGEPRALARVLDRTEYFADGRLAVIDQPLTLDGGAPPSDGDAVLDILRAVDTVEVVLYVREVDVDVVKLSARSKTDYDVNVLARKFGGGGHVKASGATIRGPLQDVRARLIEAAASGFAAAGS